MYISLPLPVFTILSTLALTSALPPSLRDILPTGQTIKQDVINIHNAVLSLDATVQAYTGAPFPTSLVGGTPVLLGVAEIHEVNRAGFRHALAAVMFSVEDTKEVIDTVVSTGTYKTSVVIHPSNHTSIHQIIRSYLPKFITLLLTS